LSTGQFSFSFQPSAFVPLAGERSWILGYFWVWNDLPTARKYLEQAIELSEPVHVMLILLEAHIGLAQVEQAEGQSAKALEWLDRAEQLARRHDLPRFLPYLAAWQARFHLQQGNQEAAANWARRCGIDASRPPRFGHLDNYYSLALVWLAQDKTKDTLALLEQMAVPAEEFNWRLMLVRIRSVQALAYHAQGQREQAFEFLAHALRLAQSSGYRRLMVDVGRDIGVLLRELVAHVAKKGAPEFPAEYAAQLLELFDLPNQSQKGTSALLLSKREIEVLKLIAAGRLNREIATELVVAASTVKTHVDKILQKLNVNTRTQAVAEAIRLKLLAEE
jgi:LuxR family transcriptional regulator, maltose regulon positive regulatory protein